MGPTVGIIGVGAIGAKIATAISDHHPIVAYDLDQDRLDHVESNGVEIASSVQDIAIQCDVVLLSLPSDEAVKAVTIEEDGIVHELDESDMIIDTSTISPNTSTEIAEYCSQYDIGFLDGPVSLNSSKGTFTMMIGGDSELLREAQPVLETFVDNIHHIGGQGKGIAMKIANNYMFAINQLGVFEGLKMAREAGIDDETFTEVARDSSGTSNALIRSMDEFILQDNYDPKATLNILTKDVRIAEGYAEEEEIPLIAGRGIGEIHQLAKNLGLGELDMAGMIKLYEVDESDLSGTDQ